MIVRRGAGRNLRRPGAAASRKKRRSCHDQDHAERRPGPFGRFTLSEAEIIDFGRRFDPQPAHTDPEFAKGTPSGKVTASAAHSFAVAIGIFARAARECKVIAAVKIHGVELPAPLVADQPIRLLAQWKEKRESNSKPDRGIATWELEAVREDGTVVLRTSATILIRRRPAA
jgi:acyl dehydratase